VETPVAVPNADFSDRTKDGQLASWQSTSSPPGRTWAAETQGEASVLICPPLAEGEKIELRSDTFALKPWHRYRLKIHWRGGLFYKWSVLVQYDSAGEHDPKFDYPLFPERDGLAPPPAWETRVFDFIVPSGASQARLVLTIQGAGDRGYRPALKSIELVDLGREPLIGEAPGPQIPRLVPARLLKQRKGGRGYQRIEQRGRSLLDLAGASVDGAGVIVTTIWARGAGKLHLTARMYAPGKGRFFDFISPGWELTDQWREYHWELPISFSAIRKSQATIVADVRAEGVVELDEPAARTIHTVQH
jgi:hypothetical protein